MSKLILSLMAVVLLSVGCGQKSTIKNDLKAERLVDAYGDGKYMVRTLTFPLSDSSLAFETPLPGIGPIVGGILKFVGDIFAKNTNMGKLQLTYTQPLPEIPERLHSVRLSRVFFYMKPQEKQRRLRDWFTRVVMGKGHVTFDFLDKFAVRAMTTTLADPDNYVSVIETRDYDRKEMTSLMEVFYYNPGSTVIDSEKAKEILLLKYDDKYKYADTKNEKYGKIHILETTHPHETKHFFMDQERMKGLYKRILILEKSLLIELVKDPVADEMFKSVMTEIAEQVEKLGVTYIDTCTPRSCLEFNVSNVNLIPLSKKGNALKLDSVIHAGKVPESFNLKGFVEFEIEIDSGGV